MEDDSARPYVVEQFLDFAWRVVVVDVHRNGAGFEATDDHVGVEVVVHDQRNAILPAFPVLQACPFPVSAEALGRKEVCQPAGAVRRFCERPATITADGDRPVGDDLGDHIQDRTYGPLAHGFARPRTFKPPTRP